MSTTGITVALNAVDQTGAAIQTAQGRFVAFRQSVETALVKATKSSDKFGDSMSRWQRFGANMFLLRNAIMAVHTATIKLTEPILRVTREMHELTDRAMETGSSASGIMALSNAFNELGVKNHDIESVTRTLNAMRKNTGDLGVDGFVRQMKSIAAIGDETQRVTELTRVFGKEGIRLEFLLRKGPAAFEEALRDCMDILPQLDEASIQTASEVDKGFEWIKRDVSSKWKEMVLDMIKLFTGDMPDGVEAGIAIAWERFKGALRKFQALLGIFGIVVYEAFKSVFVRLPKFIWGVVKTIGGTVAELGRQIWSAINGEGFDFSAIGDRFSDGWSKTVDDAVASFDTTLMDAALDIYNEVDKETQANVERIRRAFKKMSEIGPDGKSVSEEAEDAADSLGDAASKISDALNPATWMDAAGYAARTLGLAARNALGGAAAAVRSGASSAAGRGAGGSTPASAIASIRPIVSQILDAVHENGRAASSFFNTMSALEAV